MKNSTENAPEKRGVFAATLGGAGTPSSPQGGSTPSDTPAGTPAGTPACTPAGPSVGLYAMVLLVAGPVALLCLLLGVVAQVLRVPSLLVFVLAYGTGRVAKWLTAKIMGDAAIH